MIDIKGVVNYVLERQNEDGGYTFCRGTDSNAQDTYFALKILKILSFKPKKVEKTVRFLQRLQHEDGDFDSVKVAYYATKALSYLGSKPLKPLLPLKSSLNLFLKSLKHPSTYVEIVSEIESIHLAVEIFSDQEFPIDSDKIIKLLLNLKNNDGSFGSRRHSRIASTYHAIEVLRLLKNNDELPIDTLTWIRRCEIPSGGFVSSPDVSTGFLEDTYYGVKVLKIFNQKLEYPNETLKYLAKFQNPNGGFRRSVYLGISTLESTYQAISTIDTILSSKEH